MAYKFKVGDKVRIIAGKRRLENIGLDVTQKGLEGVIKSIDFSDGLPYEINDDKKWPYYLAAKDLELIVKNGPVPYNGPVDKDSLYATTEPIRKFDTGATRDTDVNKLDYEAFFSPLVLKRYAEYLNKHRVQSDGTLRDGDNWQRGLPKDVYMKSKIRHGMQTWLLFDGFPTTDEKGNSIDIEESLCAEIFNAMGYLFELLKEKK